MATPPINSLSTRMANTSSHKVCVVTGCTQGIGKETAAALAAKGNTVIMAVRNLEMAEKVAEEIRTRHPGASIIVGPRLDLSSEESVKTFAEEYSKQGWPLHILVNNAGALYQGEPCYTPSGVACPCQVNHLGPFVLTRLLEKQLVESAPSRVVTVSSVTHRFSAIGDPNTFLTDWRQGSNYGNTKLANALFAMELQRRLGPLGVQSCAVDPGAVGSSIWKGGAVFSHPLSPLKWFIDAFYAPNSDGAAAVVHAATVPWEEESAEAKEINRNWGEIEENSSESDFRFYARGMFTSPLVTSTRGMVTFPRRQRKMSERVAHGVFALSALVHSTVDYPLRWITGGKLAAKTKPVPAAPLVYDRKLAERLWEVSCDAAGLPYNPSISVGGGGRGSGEGEEGKKKVAATVTSGIKAKSKEV